MRPPIRTALALLLLALTGLFAPVAAQTNPLEPPSTGGLLAADRELAKLLVHARLLVIGAHPDDEDTSLLALVSRGMGGEAAYLSLSRGEGGQNLIGPELGVDLGLIRTEELLAARRLDGARQFFTRAYDFGYTRSLEETLQRWPKAVLLEDTVRVVRRFRPQVVVSVFPNDSRGGHGQHQAAGLIAHEVYTAAADGAAWPGLAKEGASPWAPQALYRSTWFDRDATTMVLPTGVLDPLTGKSIYQLAMASRSQHRSQDMGRLQEPGPQQARVGWVAGGEGNSGAVLFAGIDTRLRALALLLPEGAAREATWTDLEAVETLAAQARALLLPTDLSGAAEPLASAVLKLRQAHQRAAKLGDKGLAAAELLDEKLDAAERALAVVAGLVFDVAADRGAVVPGEPFPVTVTLWNSGKAPVAVTGVELESSAGWRQRPSDVVAQELLPGALGTWKLEGEVPAGAPPTVPYFLERPLQGDLYDWSTAPPSVRGLPFQPPPLRARVRLGLGALPLILEREVVYRYGDQALGELRRPLRAAPALEVAVEPGLLVWPLPQAGAARGANADSERALEVVLTSRSTKATSGKLELDLPTGWSAGGPHAFTLPAAPVGGVAREVVRLPLRLPAAAAAGSYSVKVRARLASGETSAVAVPVIEYAHIRPVPRPEPAAVDLVAAPIAVPPLRRVGYVVGASDRVPGYLLEIGIPLEILGDRELAEGNFSGYDAIVIGSRAYETVPALARANARLLDYVRAGGLLLVQYQQYPFVEGGFPPLPLEIARPHDRITDETVPVTLLDPAHRAFTTPNALGPADWSGWVQERGLYFAHTWDPGYTPLLELVDPGQSPQRGGLLVAKLGKGTYVYTGLAFFRQLPAGVPGAYRLFANLLGLGGQ